MATIQTFWFRVRNNPILQKDLRLWSRSRRMPIMLTVYVALLAIFAVGTYGIIVSASDSIYTSDRPLIGKAVFAATVLVQLVLVCFIAPGLTATAIAGERERQTFELLRTTLLSAAALVFGKLTVALGLVLVLLFATMPVMALAFILGGVSLVEVSIAVLMLLVCAFTFGSWGMFCSSWQKRGVAANILAYLGTFLGVVVPGVLQLLAAAIWGISTSGYSTLSPVIERVDTFLFWHSSALSPLGAAIIAEVLFLDKQSLWFATIDLNYILPNGINATLTVANPWWLFCILYSLFGTIWYLAAVWLVNRKER